MASYLVMERGRTYRVCPTSVGVLLLIHDAATQEDVVSLHPRGPKARRLIEAAQEQEARRA